MIMPHACGEIPVARERPLVLDEGIGYLTKLLSYESCRVTYIDYAAQRHGNTAGGECVISAVIYPVQVAQVIASAEAQAMFVPAGIKARYTCPSVTHVHIGIANHAVGVGTAECASGKLFLVCARAGVEVTHFVSSVPILYCGETISKIGIEAVAFC